MSTIHVHAYKSSCASLVYYRVQTVYCINTSIILGRCLIIIFMVHVFICLLLSITFTVKLARFSFIVDVIISSLTLCRDYVVTEIIHYFG